MNSVNIIESLIDTLISILKFKALITLYNICIVLKIFAQPEESYKAMTSKQYILFVKERKIWAIIYPKAMTIGIKAINTKMLQWGN